jgi:hypothetical protein
MNDRPGRKEPPRSHWYNPAIPLDNTPTVSPRHGRARERVRRRHEGQGRHTLRLPRLTLSNLTWGVIALAFVGVVGVISLIMLAVSGAPPTPRPTTTTARIVAIGTPTATPPISIRPWDGKQHFTILVLGLDKRPGDTGSGYSTDTLILVSVDPATKSIGMLSIPRDLYVVIQASPTCSASIRLTSWGSFNSQGQGQSWRCRPSSIILASR